MTCIPPLAVSSVSLWGRRSVGSGTCASISASWGVERQPVLAGGVGVRGGGCWQAGRLWQVAAGAVCRCLVLQTVLW